MFRFILYTLLILLLISFLRSVIGVLMKGLGAILNSSDSTPSPQSAPPKSAKLSGELHRDPVCGTFVADSTPFQRRLSAQMFYYCSDACKEKHALVTK
jgi:hypothetical protein